jgi:hypothetical protein
MLTPAVKRALNTTRIVRPVHPIDPAGRLVASAGQIGMLALFGASVQAARIPAFFLAGPLVERFDPRVLVAGAGAAGPVAALACLPLVRSRPRTASATSMRDEIGDNVAA